MNKICYAKILLSSNHTVTQIKERDKKKKAEKNISKNSKEDSNIMSHAHIEEATATPMELSPGDALLPG